MGLLNLPTPIYSLADAAFAAVAPASVRLVLWAVLAGVLSMLLYKLLSPQARIAAAKRRVVETRRHLNAHDGDFESAMPLMRAQIAAALRHVGLVLPATLLASLPVLTMLVWLETSYGYELPPPGETPRVEVTPADYAGQWRPTGKAGVVNVTNGSGAPVVEVPVEKPVTLVEKRRWWNVLIGNPLGYLPDEGPVEQIRVALTPARYLPFGPGWLGSWLAVFLPALLVTSLAMYRIARIE